MLLTMYIHTLVLYRRDVIYIHCILFCIEEMLLMYIRIMLLVCTILVVECFIFYTVVYVCLLLLTCSITVAAAVCLDYCYYDTFIIL